MKKYEGFEYRLLQFSTKFGGKTPPNGQRELTAIEWGWMHALLEAVSYTHLTLPTNREV